jgi:hypothetical protein
VELLIVILVEMLKLFTLFNKTCGYGEPVGTRLPTRVWVWDDLLLVCGYGAGYGYWFALLGTGLGKQNPWVLYPLTSLVQPQNQGRCFVSGLASKPL